MSDPNRDPIAAELMDLRRQVAALTERVAKLETQPANRKPLLCRLGWHRPDCTRCLREWVHPEPKPEPKFEPNLEPKPTKPTCAEHEYEQVGSCMSYDHFVCPTCGDHARKKAHNLHAPSSCPICSKINEAQRAKLELVAEALKL